MEFHEIANIFPLMNDSEISELAEDIKTNGLIIPITVYEGKILDGRNRYLACMQAGIEPQYQGLTMRESVVIWALSVNVQRRHLTPSQRATIAVEALPMFEKEAKERQLANLKRGDKKPVREIMPQREGKARDRAGAALGVSGRYVSEAKAIKEKSPELFEQIKRGEMPLAEALKTKKAHVSYNTGESEWYTPETIIEAARNVLGVINLDPASTLAANEVIKAEKYFTKKDDGLNQKWRGKIWMNPPYSSELIGKFAIKFIESLLTGDIEEGIVLVNNATETKWFQTMAVYAQALCLPFGRIKFWNQNNKYAAPLQGQAVLYFGLKQRTFKDCFKNIGVIFNGKSWKNNP